MARYLVADTRQLFVNGSLESLLPSSSVARSLWQAVCALDFGRFDQRYVNDAEGRPAIDPRRLAATWILALLRGVTSSVAVAWLCATDIEFRWLSGDCGVAKSSLAAFRSGQSAALTELSTQILAALSRSEMLPAVDLAVDGTIIRAAASCREISNREQLEQQLSRLAETIHQRLSEPESDAAADEVAVLERRCARLQGALSELERLGLSASKKVAVSEPEASVKRLKTGGYAPAHNVQAVTDLASGAIISLEVVARNNDKGLLLPAVAAAQARLREVRQQRGVAAESSTGVRGVVADSGYHDTRQLLRLATSLTPYVADAEQAHRRPPGVSPEYLREKFVNDAERDELICPRGARLHRRKLNARGTAMSYQAAPSVCAACPAKATCCPRSQSGRTVNRPLFGATLERLAEQLATPLGTWYRRARQVTMEGMFARLKELLAWRRCRCWGQAGAQAEGLWRMITHNLMLLIGHWQPLVLGAARPG